MFCDDRQTRKRKFKEIKKVKGKTEKIEGPFALDGCKTNPGEARAFI